MGREGNRKVAKERRKERQRDREGGGEETQLAGGVPCPGIATVGHVFSFSNMCSALGWVCVADAAGRRFLLPSSSSSFAARITQMLPAPFHKKKRCTLNDPLQRPSPALSQPTLSSLWPELRHVIISTGAGTKNNYCTNLLDTSSPYTPATSSPLRILPPFPPCSISSSTTLCCFLPTEAAQLPFGCQFACIFYLLVLNACTLCMPACVCQRVCQYVCVGVWVC